MEVMNTLPIPPPVLNGTHSLSVFPKPLLLLPVLFPPLPPPVSPKIMTPHLPVSSVEQSTVTFWLMEPLKVLEDKLFHQPPPQLLFPQPLPPQLQLLLPVESPLMSV